MPEIVQTPMPRWAKMLCAAVALSFLYFFSHLTGFSVVRLFTNPDWYVSDDLIDGPSEKSELVFEDGVTREKFTVYLYLVMHDPESGCRRLGEAYTNADVSHIKRESYEYDGAFTSAQKQVRLLAVLRALGVPEQALSAMTHEYKFECPSARKRLFYSFTGAKPFDTEAIVDSINAAGAKRE